MLRKRQKKSRTYVAKKETEDEHMFKHKPKKAWNDAKGQKEDIMGDFIDSDMLNYVTQLYTHENVGYMDGNEIEVTQDKMFSPNDVAHALKIMANGKTCNSNDICIELLKWVPIEAHAYLAGILKFAFTHCFLHDWQENWIKAIYKGGDHH